MREPVYTARNISKAFNGQPALRGVDIDIFSGQIAGLVGANGAGKSTLMKILSGALRADSGELRLDGKPLLMTSMLEAWQSGVGFVSQELNLFPPLSVAENLWLVPGRTGFIPSGDFLDAARAETERLGLDVSLSTPVAALSLADRQLVEIARALLQRPRVLILDEPTSALHASEVDRLHHVLRNLRDAGVAMVYISHFLEEVIEVADAVVVIRDGANVPLEAAADFPTVPEIVSAMLGRPAGHGTLEDAPTRRSAKTGGKTLVVEALETRSGLNVDRLEAGEGEVLGLAGLAGAGPETLFQVLFGQVRPEAGRIELPSGRPPGSNRAGAVAAGVAYFPSDRKRLGLTLEQSICENVSAVRSLSLGRDGFVPNTARQREIAAARCMDIGVKMQNVSQPVGSLSGGNQQKVVFARWLEADPSLLLLDDPMRGVDVNAKREMCRIIRDLAAEGRVILFYSTDPGDYVSVTDRVVVFSDGRVVDELSGARLTEHSLVTSMNGEVSTAPLNAEHRQVPQATGERK